MKKLIVVLLLIIVSLNFGCEKSNLYVSDALIESLDSFIDSMDDLAVDQISADDYSNYDNPLENLYFVFDQRLIKAINNKEISKGEDISDIFSDEFLSSFPSIKPESINKETGKIIEKINIIFTSYEASKCIPRLRIIENYIHSNKKLNNDYADFLLGYCTFLRHSLIIRSELEKCSKGDDTTWEECMYEKAQRFMDCDDCYLEKVVFTYTFPYKLAVWAIDCGIASLK